MIHIMKPSRRWALLLCLPLLSLSANAEITGTVLVQDSGSPGQPIEGATVRLQADPNSPVAITDASGQFTLDVEPTGTVRVTASVPYNKDASANYTSDGTLTVDGAAIEIRLPEIPTITNANYFPIKAAVPAGCGDCHSEQLSEWSGSAHSRAATDVWVLDLYSGDGTAGGSAGYVFRDVHAEATGFCATCHAPVAEAQAPGTIFLDEVLDTAALEGVTCSACHQLDHFSDNTTALHLVGDPAGATYRFPLDGVGGTATHEYVWGPLDDVDYPFMKASHALAFSNSIVCASCHEYENPENGIPGQTTYSEWLGSSYAMAGADFRSCQDCHMPEASEDGPIADPVVGSAPDRPASQRHDHSFRSVTAEGLAQSLELTASATLSAGDLAVTVSLENHGLGHAFPTGISLRNAILLVEATHLNTPLLQFGGPTVPWWADDDEPGIQEGDLAGAPGIGFAKVLGGEVQGEVTEPVLFFDADYVASDTTLAADSTVTAELLFDLPSDVEPGDLIDVRVSLLYRRAWRALAVTKGWTETPSGGPIERLVTEQVIEVDVSADDLPFFKEGFESGDTSGWSGSQG